MAKLKKKLPSSDDAKVATVLDVEYEGYLMVEDRTFK